MAQESQLSRLCELCEHINFAAIFTPREYDSVEGTMKAIYRPEWNGNGSSPVASWMSTKERKNAKYSPGSLKVNLPIRKTAHYDDLSDSESEDDGDILLQVSTNSRAVIVVEDNDNDRNDKYDDSPWEADDEDEEGYDDDSVSGEVRDRLAAEMSDLEDDGDNADDELEANEEEKDNRSVVSVSTWSGLSHFTENNRIDLNKQAAGNWNYHHGDLYYLGTIWDVRSRRRRCDLCGELWSRMRKNPAVKNEFITKSRCILKLLGLNGSRVEDPTKMVEMLKIAFIYGYKFEDPDRTDWIVKTPIVLCGTHHDVCELDDHQLSTVQAPSFDDKHYGEARWLRDRCDFGLLRGWLSTCTSKHSHPPLISDVKVRIRLIDVAQMCLVEFDEVKSNIPDYVTLSYTWGASKPRDMLGVSQLKQSKAPGFFDSEKLNTTFRDALTLCSNMGQNYLWIDALCIVQDDLNDKLQQIPQMREIYGRSLFTIIAAYGDNADAGLPRISAPSAGKFKLELKDIRVQLGGSCKFYHAYNKLNIGFRENYIRGCAYLSRAWTFQEGFLSPRVLLFTADKVYWECDRCTWCDDMHWESDTIDFNGLRAIKGTTPDDLWADRFERHAHDIIANDEDYVPPPNSYAALVKEYSNRNLTKDEDILHACNGVLAYIKQQEQSNFLHGLREKHFGNDLLFNHWTAVASRFPGQTSTESGFPSWSWAAWRGSIQIANQPRGNSYDLAENLVPCDGVRCFVLEDDENGSRNLRVINEDGGWRFALEYVRVGEGIYDPTELNYEYEHTTGKITRPELPKSAILFVQEDDSGSDVVERRLTSTAAHAEIPVYDQDVTLSDLTKHPAFHMMQPSLHIVFKTFSTLVVLVHDYDEWVIQKGDPIIGGTKMLRSEGVWGNKDTMARRVYACRKVQDANAPKKYDPCPCCGKDNKRDPIPEDYELGPYLGRLPALSTAWDRQEYIKAIPSGLYRMLWMNNNQLPMFGHILCKPVSPTASKDGRWDGEIMQRVSSVIGPTEVMTKVHQEFYCAEWGTHILA